MSSHDIHSRSQTVTGLFHTGPGPLRVRPSQILGVRHLRTTQTVLRLSSTGRPSQIDLMHQVFPVYPNRNLFLDSETFLEINVISTGYTQYYPQAISITVSLFGALARVNATKCSHPVNWPMLQFPSFFIHSFSSSFFEEFGRLRAASGMPTRRTFSKGLF